MALDAFEQRARHAKLNEYQMRDLVTIIDLIGDEELGRRARKLIRHTPRYREVLPGDLPPLSLEGVLATIERFSSDPIIGLTRQGRWRDAVETAKSPLEVQDICLTLALLGEFGDALELALHPVLEPPRRKWIYETILIEGFRRRDAQIVDRASNLLAGASFDYLFVAIGILGRRPFEPYPYADW